MDNSLPETALEIINWTWPQIEPYYQELASRPLNGGNMAAWLADWSRLNELLYEADQRLYVATTVNTADRQAAARYEAYLDEIYPASQAADQVLKEKLLASGLEPAGYEIPLRNLRSEASLFREANLPLLAQDLKLSTEYDQITGNQTVEWEGREVPILQMDSILEDPERGRRERAWRLASERWLADRPAIDDLWDRFMAVRLQQAANAGFGDYRSYRWKQMLRFDYTPQDCLRFHQAIEEVVVPAVGRIYEKRRQRMGLDSLRPWDLNVDPLGRPALKPFQSAAELEAKAAAMFFQVDPQLGKYFEIMRQEGLLDLENRKNKAPGAYCTDYLSIRRPFIFANAVGIHEDVQTVLHEAGHAFHVFEAGRLPYFHQLQTPTEFSEVASMSMELLASPYLPAGKGGFYTEKEAARALVQHLTEVLRFWPYMAIVDAFQHWVYENPGEAADPGNCDAKWAELWKRFRAGEDWSGLEQEMMTGWHRKLHIHQSPFYYIEYGLAQLGAVQVWHNALTDQAGAVAAYRRALSLGGTVSLPQLFAAAGARFTFEAEALQQAVDLIERTVEEVEEGDW